MGSSLGSLIKREVGVALRISTCLFQTFIPSLPAKLKLDKIENFRYLNKSGCYSVEKIDDKEDFEKMRVGLFSSLGKSVV